ncbi:MAG: hypothetical protein UZ08_BCD001002438 [Candidatus Parvibacillus calidus]|jgi:hypothetical protein|nr:MAG: hypothetical protein UZ08_BCD001002438 [Candidatus Parvibacillus calidus]
MTPRSLQGISFCYFFDHLPTHPLPQEPIMVGFILPLVQSPVKL